MKDVELYKKVLLDEKINLTEEILSVGKIRAKTKEGYEATAGDITENIDSEDENSLADKFEEYEDRSAVEKELEIQLHAVNKALERIKLGEYGRCHICGREIEEERLVANPSAETCKIHINN